MVGRPGPGGRLGGLEGGGDAGGKRWAV